jgi:uncharacterized membrane protein YcjF (UPF0283 family)
MNDFMSIVVFTLIVIAVIFFLMREVNCWYWKINERLEEQKKTNELLTKIAVKMGIEDINENSAKQSDSESKISHDSNTYPSSFNK